MRSKRLLAFGIVAVLTATAWLMFERRPSQTSRAGESSPTASAAQPVSMIDRSTDIAKPAHAPKAPVIAHQLPNSRVPLEEAVTLLREYANLGDTDAQLELTRRLSICSDQSLRRSEEMDHTDSQRNQEEKTDPSLDESQRARRAENLRLQIEDRAKVRAECLQLPADVRASWLDGVDAAAHAGNVEAMRQYSSFALTDFDTLDAVIADVDTAIERRDKARAYLLQAAEAGDVAAVRDLAYAYQDRIGATPSAFRADAVLSYAYAYAGTLAGASKNGDLDWLMSNNEASLDAKQLGDAQSQGQAIYERCCARH